MRLSDSKIYDILNARAEEAKRQGMLHQVLPMLEEIGRRRLEAVALYTPYPAARFFHASLKTWRIIDGSNKSGKTTAACAEDVMAVLGLLPGKYPVENGSMILLGQKQRHLADPFYRILCQPGAFSVVDDEITGLPRSVRSDPANPSRLDPYDEAYREKWRPAPPFLPDQRWGGNERRLAHTKFEDAGENVPAQTTIPSTGWKILWRSSEATPDQGGTYNAVHIDEQIESDDWFNEIIRGMMLEPGGITPRGIWSATPQNCHHLLQEMRERADASDAEVDAFQLLLRDNIVIREERKAAFEALLDEDQQETRIAGRYAIAGMRIYPMFRMQGGDESHGYEPFEIPDDWARYFCIDPGRNHCGILLVAVDPDEAHRWIYDGVDLRQQNSRACAEWIAARQGRRKFEAGYCDHRMGRQIRPGDDTPVEEYYRRALAEAGVEVRRMGPACGFIPGCDKLEAREEALREWMRIRTEDPFAGTPLLKIARGRIPKLERQLRNAHDMSRKTADAKRKVVCDLAQCNEYLAAGNPYYWPPEPLSADSTARPYDPAWDALVTKRRRRNGATCVVL